MIMVSSRGTIQKRFLPNRLILFRLGLAFAVFFIIFSTCVLNDIRPWDIRSLLKVPFLELRRQRHLVLVWTPFFGLADWLPSTKELGCPIDDCDLTIDPLQYKESSAVIVHWRDIDAHNIPHCLSPSHMTSGICPLLVLFNKESPLHTSHQTIEDINDKIHWIVSYRRDSDVFAPYGKLEQRNADKIPDINLNRSSICWLVSNCHTPSNREDYVEELQKFIPIKMYGKCSNSSCPHEDRVECYKWLSNDCKFYLSFENSICKDYSTEKLYLAMTSDMVPIVLGGDNYTKYLPDNSFIDISDFSSPKHLAQYLKELLSDDSKYLSYFRWKLKYIVREISYEWFCDMCEKLHSVNLKDVKPHPNFKKWWYMDSDVCKSNNRPKL